MGECTHDRCTAAPRPLVLPSDAVRYLYLSAVLGLMSEKDEATFEAMASRNIGGHKAKALADLYAGN